MNSKLFPVISLFALAFSGACNKTKTPSALKMAEACKPVMAGAAPETLSLTSVAHDFSFPDHRAEYEDGTLVLQPKDGRVYRCKPHPYSEYCKQWSHEESRFEPGVGTNWIAAWDRI